MKPREKVVLAVVGLGIVCAGAFSMLSGEGPATLLGPDRAEAEKKAKEVLDAVRADELDTLALYRLALAQRNLTDDPFARAVPARDASGPEDSAEVKSFAYSGFMEMGETRFAIINGLEYVEGDELEDGGYFVRDIRRSRVVIERRDEVQGISRIITVPIQEGEESFFPDKEQADAKSS